MRIFSNDAALIALGRGALRYCAMAVPLTGIQIIGGGVFQALGKPVQALLLSLSRQVLVLIPLVLIMPRLFGLNGVWLSFPMADIVSFLITLIFLITAVRNLPHEARSNAVV
jgi:Na+-driven multidrug efflux pump